MKRLLLTTASVGVLAFSSPAMSADLYVKARAPLESVYNWTGGYIGGFGGYGFGNHNIVNAALPVGFANFTANYENSGGFGGGELGYNWQAGSFVYGIEADYGVGSLRGSDNFAQGFDDASRLKSLGSVRARGGLAVDRLLLFFDAGYAYGNTTHTNTNPGVGIDQFNVSRSGYTAGGGIGYAMTNDLIGKVEYRYYDLGNYSRANPTNGVIPYTVSNTYSTLLVGLDFKFGSGSLVAKY
jgi:outer membrane immunogenic protein